MQLDALLRSFRLCCEDAPATLFRVLYKATSPAFHAAYREVAGAFPEVVFVEERDFKRQLEEMLAESDLLLFLVDDSLFVQRFSFASYLGALAAHPDAVGVSLRLGRNTNYCYSLSSPQSLPTFEAVGSGLLRYRWPGAQCDFGYPLEVSSSLYARGDLLPLLRDIRYTNPNTLEAYLAGQARRFASDKPILLCSEQSVAFSVPANRVQSTFANRVSSDQTLSADELLRRFVGGERIDVESMTGFVPNAAHQEVALRFAGPFTPRLDLRPIFKYAGHYAVLRLPEEFPSYPDQFSLSILCDDVDAFRAHVLSCGSAQLANGFRIEEHREGAQVHLDFFHCGAARLNLSFDLTASLSSLFDKVTVDPALTTAVLAERQCKQFGAVQLFVPQQRHELALRLLEHRQGRELQPYKAKHLEYIDRANDFSFLEVVNAHTGLQAVLNTDTGQAVIELTARGGGAGTLPAVGTKPPRKQRMDYFLVWSHGLAHTEEIMDSIRRHPALQITAVVKRTVKDMAGLVQGVYEKHGVPKEDLLLRTRYLQTLKPEVLFILAKNLEPKESYFGDGQFRHIQCRNVRSVKEEIRERFNLRREGKPTEDHVIHGSDYPSQVRRMLKTLGLPALDYYCRIPSLKVHAPYHIAPFEEFEVKEVPISNLRATILGRGQIPLEETPHYQYLAGNTGVYRAYHAAHMGVEFTDDHFPAAFDRLKATFDPERTERDGKLDLILAVPINSSTFGIIDGVHRGALLRHREYPTVRIAIPSWPKKAATTTPPLA